jgi:ribonuclease-3
VTSSSPPDLEERLGYRFRDRALLGEALTHPSCAAEAATPLPHNQRLEFLGDAVLQFVVTDLLFRRYPEMDEGDMTRLRSALTNEEALAGMAQRLDLSAALRLGRGERLAGGRDRPSTLADALEAVIGALFLDGGADAAAACIRPLILAFAPDPVELLLHENPKGRLQELTQAHLGVTPAYDVLRVSGPDHLPEFEVSVSVGGVEYGRAQAGSRKDAEKEAARLACHRLLAGGLPLRPAPPPGETECIP